MRILYCGPFISDSALKEKRAVNQASARWSREFLRALSKVADVDVISHCPEQRWPVGKVFWQNDNKKWFDDFISCERIPYFNVVGLKDAYLSMAYRKAARRLLRNNKYDAYICYNTWHSFHVAAMEECQRAGVKCVPIILDGDDPRKDDWGWIKRSTKAADGIIFLSWWMKENCPCKVPKLHMDGGAELKNGETHQETRGACPGLKKRKGEKWLVHTGTMDELRGLGFMASVIKACARQDVRFIFCGKCDKTELFHALGEDSRVDVRGFVSEAELDEISRVADVFLNVRDPQEGDNILNYPSKVPQYLAWGKPVVSTWIDSFSPDYRDVLEVCDNTPMGFAKVLENVLNRGADENLSRYRVIKDWFVHNKPWDVQVGRVFEFIKGLM